MKGNIFDMWMKIQKGDLISSSTTKYLVQKYLGFGSYGVVFRCRDESTNEKVALKVIESSACTQCEEEEVVTLQTLQEHHSEMFNIVRLIDSFTFKENVCFVFELLDINLHKFMKINPGRHLELKQIRPILQQLGTSLEFLKGAGIIHADLKPQNIMMVDHVKKPLKVKVIDFGSACNNPKEQIGVILQSLWYRAPEILKKAPFDEAIDVWSLGCISAELFMGQPLFPAWNETDMKRQIYFATGKPLHEGDDNPYWFWPKYWMETRFMMIPRLWGDDDQAEVSDMECFVDLLEQMLMMNQFERIVPRKILLHPFITMSHFKGPFKNSSYVKLCQDLMEICQDRSSPEGGQGDQLIPQDENSSGSTADHSPGDSQVKIRRSERLAATRKDTGGQTGPVKSQRNRTRDDPTSDGSPSTSKRNVSLKKEQTDRVRDKDKSQAAPSNLRRQFKLKVHSLRRSKRNKEKVPVLDKTSRGKGKRRRPA
ncbi:homeodomain-interacting protein kinase 1-like [Limanda limanda]|uniref:homeodomain-interacting protein kinase 1-like n=1 Tax=Limanda limanda TaxID=27771 RepID=UPI0029C68100|nr:homeodomain-interacting protein kinase 1-like [Limanda limanda]